ncbi:MAG TPA: carboxylesterase family protein [Thermoanaerobaculia bacterium]|nr:carboxylesterase family protein [Thermoanaerobaculia bacterium]
MPRKLLITFLISIAAPLGAQQLTTPVNTTEGPVRGELSGSVSIYRGIPYAAPPVGDLRWKEPQLALPRGSTLDALAFHSVCPQIVNDRLFGSEDCLALNIWAPSPPGSTLRPVMLSIQGIDHVTGSSTNIAGNGRLLNGFYLAKNKLVVVVTINYRLGALGFLAHPSLTAENAHHSSGNYGLLDQIAALRWVSQNISNFGGDPENVTIFGQSSGAADVFSLVVSPLAAGLFDRAIVESAPSLFQEQPLSSPDPLILTAEKKGVVLSSVLGCEVTADRAACLRSRSASDLVLAIVPRLPGQTGSQYMPNVDGYVLQNCAASSIASGRHNAVPMIMGVNKDDGASIVDLATISKESDFDRVVRGLEPGLSDKGLATLKAVFNQKTSGSWAQAANVLAGDLVYVCPTRRALEILSPFQSHLYFYDFTHALVGSADPKAFHGEELRFVFGTLQDVAGGVTPSAGEMSLSVQIMTYWTNLARNGEVNAGVVSHWREYDPVNDVNLFLDTPISTASGLENGNCAFLSTVLARELPTPPLTACRPPRRHGVRN